MADAITIEPPAGPREPSSSALRFGGHACVREMFAGAVSSMYIARAVSGGDDVAVKALHPPPATSLRRALDLEGFLTAAEVQQQAAAGGARSVGAVIEAGTMPGGCYIVRPYYRSSLQAVFDAHVAPELERLQRVVRTLLDALAEWERATGRAHGNFKPANVFFATEPGAADRWQIVLVDPWFQPGDAAVKRQARDMEQLGRWIVRWIRRRDAGGWPIEDSPEWKVLGRAASPWREFCNSLLDPNATPEMLTFASVRARLDRLPAHPPGRWVGPAAAALVVISGAVGGYARLGAFSDMPGIVRPLAEKLGNPGARVEAVPVEFGELCTEWDQWLAALLEQLQSGPVRQRWLADRHLASAVLPLLARPADLDPRVFTGQEKRRFEALRESPPDSARRTVVVEKVLRARGVVARVSQALEEWPGWKARTDLLAEWAAQGWRGAATLHQLPAPPALSTGGLGRAIDDALVNQAGIRTVVAEWTSFKTDAAALVATGDPVQAAMPAFYAAQVGDPENPAEFAAKLGAAAADLKPRAEFARGDFARRVDRDRYRSESFVQTFTAPLTAESLAQWERELPDYFRVEGAQDPRGGVEWDRLLAEVDRVRAEMVEAENEDPDTAATVAVKSDSVAADALAVRERLRVLRAEAILVKDTARVAGVVAALDRDLGSLLGRARDALDELQPTLEKLKAWLLTRTFANAVLGAAWSERSQRLAREAEAADGGGNLERFKQVRRAARVLASYLGAAEAAIKELGEVELPAVDPEVARAVVQLETERRDQLSRSVLAATVFRNDAPAAEWTAAVAGGELGGLIETYRRWQRESAEFAAELAALGAHLREGFDWSEGVEADLAALTKREQTAGVMALGGVAADWIRTARRLEALDTTSDAAALREAAADPAFAVRLSAWRRLGGLQEWPAGASDLEIEGQLATDIGRLGMSAIPAGVRQQRLLAELREQTKVRWNRAARRAAADETQLAAVFDLMAKFTIAPEDLESDVRFNHGLRRMKTMPFTRLSTAELRQQRDAFLAEVGKLRAVAARADVAEFMKRVEECELSAAPRPVTPRELGPAAAGWTGDFAADGRRVTFEWKSQAGSGPEFAIEYVLVEPPDGVPFFLATQAVPVAAFIDLLEFHPAGKDVYMPEWIEDVAKGTDRDVRRGPQTWEVRTRAAPRPGRLRDSHLVRSDRWLLNPDAKWPDVVYGEPPTPERPTPLSPIQNLPPRTALTFTSHVLGARLPSVEEWQGIVRLHGQEARKGNLRDETWEQQRLYLLKQGDADEFPWPDVGGFPTEKKSRQQATRAVEGSDGTLWFNDVNEGPDVGGLRNLFGNVAIYLFDEGTSKFFVAGGSAISPPEIDPVKPYDVSPHDDGFADVGFRPAFDASPEMIQRAKLMRIIRSQSFITI